MKFLIFGDIYGKNGRRMIAKHLPDLRAKYVPDVVMANNENISHGKGPRMNQIHWCEQQGIDIFTGGNHSFENVRDIAEYMNAPESKQLRPDNILGDDVAGAGHRVYEFDGRKILVINLMGIIFMGDKLSLENPYQRINGILSKFDSTDFEAILVDFHKETTSEGYAMANHLDGRVSLLWGTHTHVQTADAEIWPDGMGFINDIGFAGARRSLIGVEWETSKHRFIEGRQEGLMSPDDIGPGVLSGMYAEIVDRKCIRIEPFRIIEDDVTHVGSEQSKQIKPVTITIDGPAGSGKGTTAKMVAEKLGFKYLDSGSMYRALGVYLNSKNIDVENVEDIDLNGIKIDFSAVNHVQINGEDYFDKIRNTEASVYAYKLGVQKNSRELVISSGQKIIAQDNYVLEGRDTGTIWAPNACVKIYLIADATIRAHRRWLELQAKGENISEAEVLIKIVERDNRDMTRTDGPLRKPEGAYEVDTSHISIEEQVERIYEICLDELDKQKNNISL